MLCIFLIVTHRQAYNATVVKNELSKYTPCTSNIYHRYCNGIKDEMCDIETTNTGSECYPILAMVSRYYEMDGIFASIPASSFFRAPWRKTRAIAIVKKLAKLTTYYDGTGHGPQFDPKFTISHWHGHKLTSSVPRSIGIWQQTHLNSSSTSPEHATASQGIFAVPLSVVRKSNSLVRYRHLQEQFASCAHCEACHYMERLWYFLFGHCVEFRSAPCLGTRKSPRALV